MGLECAFPATPLQRHWECVSKDAHLFVFWILVCVPQFVFVSTTKLYGIHLFHKHLLCTYYVSDTICCGND